MSWNFVFSFFNTSEILLDVFVIKTMEQECEGYSIWDPQGGGFTRDKK